MATRNARLHLTPGGTGSFVELDGQRLPGVRGVTLTHKVRRTPTITVDLVMHEIEVDGEMTVTVPDKTREALIALGWTPPGEEIWRCQDENCTATAPAESPSWIYDLDGPYCGVHS